MITDEQELEDKIVDAVTDQLNAHYRRMEQWEGQIQHNMLTTLAPMLEKAKPSILENCLYIILQGCITSIVLIIAVGVLK